MAEYIDVGKLQKEFEEVCVGECDCCAREEGCPVYTQPTVNAIPIPEGATNGDMIKTMFPNAKVNNTKYSYVVEVKLPYHTIHDTGLLFDKDWWNAPYKGARE